MTFPEKEKDPEPIIKQLLKFYFSNSWYSFFTITYLLFFAYSAIYYFDNVILAIKFIFYTIGLSTPLLGLSSWIWGITFIISLIIPFSVSLYAIFIFFNLWDKQVLQIKQKFIFTILVIIATVLVIISMDDVIRTVAKQQPLQDFVQKNELTNRLMGDVAGGFRQ